MGLMDIGSGNPYARINPLAAFIDQGLKGYQSEEARFAAKQKDAAAQAQQAQLMAMKQAEAQRAADQDAANKLAANSLRDRIAATYDRPIQTGLLSMGDIQQQSVLPQDSPYGVQAVDTSAMRQPVLAGKPMTQQDWLQHAAQYAGTPTATAAMQIGSVQPKESFAEKLIATGKYDPASVMSFLQGQGQLKFAKDPTVVTWSEPYYDQVGGKKVLLQRSSAGQVKPVVEDKSSTVVVSRDGGSPLQQSSFVDPNSGVPLVYDKRSGTYKPATIEGGVGIVAKPAAWTPETAAKASLLDSSAAALGEVRKLIYDKDGRVNRGNVANAATRTWFTDGRQLDAKIKAAVEGVLRAESGAAVPDNEVKRASERFRPQVGDSDETIASKLNALDGFVSNARGKIQQGRPRESVSTNTNTPPDGAVAQLRANPKLAVFFDQKYGKGASQRYLGGK